jgi:hypothetical protein
MLEILKKELERVEELILLVQDAKQSSSRDLREVDVLFNKISKELEAQKINLQRAFSIEKQERIQKWIDVALEYLLKILSLLYEHQLL